MRSLLLAGGRSSRMGSDKALIEVDGVACIARVAMALAEAGREPIRIAVAEPDAIERYGSGGVQTAEYNLAGNAKSQMLGTAGQIKLVQRCPVCGEYRNGGLRLQGRDADRTLRRVLAYHHFAGASERRVVSAAKLIQEAGSPQDLTRIVVKDGRSIGDLQRTGAIALKVAANESAEQKLLELELAQLETHWREEEEMAAIVDGELTPLALLENLRRKVTGRG